jgi:hypothetical protein
VTNAQSGLESISEVLTSQSSTAHVWCDMTNLNYQCRNPTRACPTRLRRPSLWLCGSFEQANLCSSTAIFTTMLTLVVQACTLTSLASVDGPAVEKTLATRRHGKLLVGPSNECENRHTLTRQDLVFHEARSACCIMRALETNWSCILVAHFTPQCILLLLHGRG